MQSAGAAFVAGFAGSNALEVQQRELSAPKAGRRDQLR
jgi:hypothetical protein